jgi:hypothetical protein
MKKLPLISLVSFFILIPTITLADNKDGYEYKSTTTVVSNNYYLFDEPSTSNPLGKETTNYTLFTNFANDWYSAELKEIPLKESCDETKFDGTENCWPYARFYYIADQIYDIGTVVETSEGSGIYSRELKSKIYSNNVYHGHSAYKPAPITNPWTIVTEEATCKDNHEPRCEGELDNENVNSLDKYWERICSSIPTENKVSLIYYDEKNQTEKEIKKDDILEVDKSTVVKIVRDYNKKFEDIYDGIKWNSKMPPHTNNNITSCGGTYPMDNGVHSVVLINAQAKSTEKQCVEIKKTSSAKCNESAKMENVKCLKTITKGKNRRDVKLDQTATLTNILTPTKIYQGGGIKLGFMYYNTVKWKFTDDEQYGNDDSEIRGLLESKLKKLDELENDIVVEVSLKDKNGDEIGKIDNIQKKCEQKGEFTEGKTVTTTCTFLLPESIVKLGTGKVDYNNSSGQGINNEYYTPITYTGELSLEAEIKNIGVLKEVDGWTNNWTLKYDGENDDSCKVNVTSRLYKPDQSNKYAFIYRPIDINNPFPNRNAGVNWYDWYSIPANKERLKSSYSKEEYQVILDNQSVSKIKEYNNDKNNNYLDWTGINKKTEKSEFIDKYNIVRIQEGGNP